MKISDNFEFVIIFAAYIRIQTFILLVILRTDKLDTKFLLHKPGTE